MYLRKSKKPNGRTYLTIAQGYRDEDGKNRARTVKSLGYVDALEAEFDDPVAHFEEECRRMTAEAARAEEDGFRMRGVSKEHRPSPIVQMGLFLDSDGLPLGYELFPGNRNDMTTLLPAMSKAGVRDLPRGERVVVVADKGLNTSANIAACVLDGNGYIFSQSVRKATKGLESWVLDDAGYGESAPGSFKIKSRVSEKAVYVAGEDGKRRRVMVPVKEVAFWSRDYLERSRRERAKVVEKSRAAVARGDMPSAAAKTPVRYARDVPVVRETGEAPTTTGSSTRRGSPPTRPWTATTASSPPSRTWTTARSSTPTAGSGGSRSPSG